MIISLTFIPTLHPSDRSEGEDGDFCRGNVKSALKPTRRENYPSLDSARYALFVRCLRYYDKQYSKEEYSLERARCFAGLGCALHDRESCGISDPSSQPDRWQLGGAAIAYLQACASSL